MADKLDWLNKHLVAVRYTQLADVLKDEGFKIPPGLEPYFQDESAEACAFALAKDGKYKEACDFLPYLANRRAAVWWAYRCVMSLIAEWKVNPVQERDIADIGADMKPKVPDWAKVEIPKLPPGTKEKAQKMLADSHAQLDKARATLDPQMLKLAQDAAEVAFAEFKRVNGIHPIELLKKVCARLDEPKYVVDPKSPIFTESAKLKAEIEAMRLQTVATIKSVLPPKIPAHEKKLRDDALTAVYRWVAAPDAENSQRCMDMGNTCPGTPAGLLSLSAFWAFGNLLPKGEQVVATPPGLAANGIVQTLLMCSLAEGGTRNVKERYELYYNLGIDVLTGKDTWAESLADAKLPHQTVEPAVETKSAPSVAPETAAYRRWKPEAPQKGEQ
jgi:hypothetical protein